MLPQEVLDTLRRMFDEAKRGGDPDATPMCVSTAGPGGQVSARMVLLKQIDERGLCFFSNYESDKGRQIDAHPQLALTLYWPQLQPRAQVRVEGRAERIDAAESDAYFATRARLRQLGAWASQQSRTLPDRDTLAAEVARYEREFEGKPVPRPPHWGGYRVVPELVEFWYAHKDRLNERERWERVEGEWRKRLLYP
ncbi:MAG TPA: pyridoxamine 5'-phosphate oxidase [Rhodanobacteraceae bacterium]|nr:pyridoxamine 5'-phosphate oxidase [Rhodanobacteraceae bacterium]